MESEESNIEECTDNGFTNFAFDAEVEEKNSDSRATEERVGENPVPLAVNQTKLENFINKDENSNGFLQNSTAQNSDAQRLCKSVSVRPRYNMTIEKSLTMDAVDRVGRKGGDDVDTVPLQRRLSVGDVPYSCRQHVLHSPEENFILGRADAIPPATFLDAPKCEVRHRIHITEVVPSDSSIIDGEKNDSETDWRMSISKFTDKKYGKETSKLSKRMRSFYKAQDDLINAYEDLNFEVDDAMENAESFKELRRTADRYAKGTLIINTILMIAKLVVSIMSGSISIISSLVDSCFDLASGALMTISEIAMRNRDPYVYPQGRTKLEPVSIVILSVVMIAASLMLIRESIEKMVGLIKMDSPLPNFDVTAIVITSTTIVTKLVLFLLCRRVKTSSIQALAQDHRNDVISNSVALIFGYIGSQEIVSKTGVYELCYLDPIGAILISIYIAINWCITGYGQTKLLTGHTAKPDFLKKLTWLCVNHHPKLQYVDTVRAFHFGTNFLVEVDIVLPEDMTLKEAHDIGEPLQKKLEKMPEVERAFVHLDYEFEHRPADEHKQV